MAMSVFRQLPIISAVGGVIGGVYWTFLPDLTVTEYGAPAKKKRLSYFSEDKVLDEKTLGLTKEVEDKLLLKNASVDNLSGIEYFWCKGLDMVAIGNANYRGSSFIGLPVSFLYQSIEQVKLPLEYPPSDQLRQGMVLSDSAKKFAIASAYYQLDSLYLTGQLFAIGMISLGPYSVVYYMQEFFKKKSLARQFSLFCAVCAGFVVVFRYMSQFVKFLNVCYADKLATELGEDYLNGGIEYFTKTLDRNKAIHSMDFANDLSRGIDKTGNQIYGFLDIPDPLFTTRLEMLKKIFYQKKQKSN